MHKKYKILLSLFFSLLIFLAFTPPLNPTAGGWTQQFMPNLGGRSIVDITFTDSLNGYAITNRLSVGDTSFILKTSNGGDNWIKIYGETTNSIFKRVQFLNTNTGYVGGLINFNYILKTTNAGINWSYINAPYNIAAEDMYVLNEDTIWIVFSESLTGGVYRTTNGGASWDRQFTTGTSHIYMYNASIGFIDGGGLKKTTDGGFSWIPIAGEGLFLDMHFVDSLTGWKCFQSMKKTTDGGLTWVSQILPSGGNIVLNYMLEFSVINRDTIWGTGGTVYFPGNGNRGMIFRSTDGGENWLYQIPDTSIHIGGYYHIKFFNRLNGWAYATISGVHTNLGGDTTFLTGIQQIGSEIPKQFKLYQNYPNPFNPRTVIKYEVRTQRSEVRLVVYNINGREVTTLVNGVQNTGTYEVDFSGNGLSSGVYFYKITINTGKEVFIDTKKAILIK